ncbi:MAG: hypothetical protein ACOZQL_10830 [Myxococcota bacterium]
MKYATDTSVSVAKSRGEIESLLSRAGAGRFFSGAEEGRAFVGFSMRCNQKPCPSCSPPHPSTYRSACGICERTGKVHETRNVMFELPLPKASAFARDGRGRARSATSQHAAWEQACRSAWRALFLAIKAKLVSVESGVETFEEAFLAQLVVKDEDGRAVRFGTRAVKAIAESYERNGPPQLLLGSGR